MNDYYVTKYTEQKFMKHDFKTIKRFIIENLSRDMIIYLEFFL